VYFPATTAAKGIELWKTDGTAPGTVLVEDINAGPGSAGPTSLTPALGTMFFRATDVPNGAEPWRLAIPKHAPVAVDDAYEATEDTTLTVPAPGVLANDTDGNGDALSAGYASDPANGSVALEAGGSFTYTPDTNFNGTDTFTYVVDDGDGGVATGTVAITVNPVNDAPVATGESYTHYGSDTALEVTGPGVLANDADPVEGSPLTAVLDLGPANGTLTLNPNGSFTYQAREDFVGTDSFTYKADDGAADSNVVTVSIIVGAGCRGQQATLVGTSGTDRLTGTKNADVIVGLGGNDTLNGAAGNDVICGGSGKDTVNTGAGDDYGDGGSGDDNIKGDVGNDTLIGGDGADTVNGDDGNDLLSGGAGTPDSCQAGAGTDALAPAHGCEKVNGVP
jgi:ELWxxDGT repeat protein